ncbi:MAG TPA: AAA family ATPase [Leptospiraceae bacterium]|nr:AAA family ATPase [Leptospiraceae bacterium]HRG73343.1 AAA family ATPase [Leptospiraceae bacterium]
MKIRRLKIVGYKVIDCLDLDFTDANGKTLDTIIFAGLNGCGKTTILEAIQSVFSEELPRRYKRGYNNENRILASEIVLEFTLTEPDFKEKFISVLRNGLSEIEKIIPEKLTQDLRYRRDFYRKEFIQNTLLSIDKSNFFKLSYTSDGKELLTDDFEFFYYFSDKIVELGFNLTFIPYETYMVRSRHSSDDIKDNESVNEEIQRRKKELLRIIDFEDDKTLIKSYIINEFLQSIVTDQDTIPRITMAKIIDKVNRILQHITLNTTLKEIDTKQIKFKSSNGQIITIDGLSSGEKQLFYRFVYLQTLEIQNSIIMVDEPETSLHPTWQQQLAKLYQSIGINNQIILATHSPHILASVKPENIFLLSVKDSKIEANHLKDTDLKTKGVETNRILKEIMGVTKLMDEETSADMIALNQFIEADTFDKPEAIEVYNRLLTNLGKEDSYIVSVDFEIVMRNKMREKKLKAVV